MLKKKFLTVPEGIEFISNWKDYIMPEGHCIVDKGVTGCGYTEMCIQNDLNVILCSPRKLLLENKAEQHEADENVLYLVNTQDAYLNTKDSFRLRILEHLTKCKKLGKPVKFLITYDSIKYIIENLKELQLLDDFYFVADEFQAIFIDSYFKAEVEDEFVENLQNCKNVIYLSATPMLDKYLERLDAFKDLPMEILDWSKTGFVETIKIQRKQIRNLAAEADKIIQRYLIEDFPVIATQDGRVVQSKEAVIYVNSISEIIKIINRNKLTSDQCNVICSNQPENLAKLRKINKSFSIGKIPLKGEPNKMFTFCTSTCYIGSDFWSDNASTYIFADPNLRCLALDISLDLPQIAGRQRNKNNPFKNYINIFYRVIRGENIEDRAAFEKIQQERINSTDILLKEFANMSELGKQKYLKKLTSDITVSKYADDFLSISKRTSQPTYNKLIEVASERAWEVAQKDYQDSINVTRAIANLEIVDEEYEYKDRDDKIVDEFLDTKFYKTPLFTEKMKLFCGFMDEYKDNKYIMNAIQFRIPDPKFLSYYNFFGTSGCRANSYKECELLAIMTDEVSSDKLTLEIYNNFNLKSKVSKKDIKEKLKEIYTALSLNRTAKATDIEEWFEARACNYMEDGKKVHGFELLALKKN